MESMQLVEVLIAAVAAFMLGFGWYTFAFGKAWQAETGITEEQAQSGMGMTHGLAFVMMLVLGAGQSYFIHGHPLEYHTFTHGAFHGVQIAGAFAIPAMSIHYLYQKKSLKLWLIDAGYLLAFMALMGGIVLALKMHTGIKEVVESTVG